MIIANTCSKGAFTKYVDKSLAFLITYPPLVDIVEGIPDKRKHFH
jgi:hypothetical protein